MISIRKLLLISKLKLFASIGAGLVTASATPLIWMNSNKWEVLTENQNIKNLWTKAKEALKIEDITTQLTTKYKTNYQEATTLPQNVSKKFSEKYNSVSEEIKNGYNLAYNYSNEANYWIWKLNSWTKNLIKWIPDIIKDSFLEVENSSSAFLSFQKIYKVVKSANFKNFVQELSIQIPKHKNVLENASEQVIDEFINYFKSHSNEETEIDKTLKQLEENAKKLEGSYQCARKLIYHLMNGTTFLDTLINSLNSLNSLNNSVTSQETALKTAGVEESAITQLKNKISELKNKISELEGIKNCGASNE